jgi:hypothetical protein
MKPLVLNSFIFLLFVGLVFSSFYSENLIIFEPRLPVSDVCNETIYSDAIECIREANRKYNITLGQEKYDGDWCYAQWEMMCCTIHLVKINCTAEDLEYIESNLIEAQQDLERDICKEYPRNHILCYELPEFTSTEWLSTQETSESTFETQETSESTFDTQGTSGSTFGTQGTSGSTFDTQGTSGSTFETQETSESTFETQTSTTPSETTEQIEDIEELKDDIFLWIAIGIGLIVLICVLIAIVILRKKIRRWWVSTGIQLSSLSFNDNYYLLIFTFA